MIRERPVENLLCPNPNPATAGVVAFTRSQCHGSPQIRSRATCPYLLTVRLFFVDDSGDEQVTVLTAMTMDATDWRGVLRAWLGWRKWLYKHYGLPTDFELHAQEFISGHGEISYTDQDGLRVVPEISASKGLRREAYRRCLEQIARQAGNRFLTVQHPGPRKSEAYDELITWIEQLLDIESDLGIVIVDGKDDSEYRPAHRRLNLKLRRVIEDPLMQPSDNSQLIQMVDLVVHAAFQHLKANADHRFMWDWYPDVLEPILVMDGPAPGIRST